ncbi:hypothetical protein [Streptomyces sp. NBC_00829]|uniref:hypothetical protein n=1 Tax=Streptomyces sp. NBC_00829 TaxID=2903679 RepID=UPI003864E523|nr:SMI1/KNR4 family protein [Streptomyces sp. NBC_00829]
MGDPKTSATRRDRLVQLVAPPSVPVDAHGEWAAVETVIGTRLPNDYKQLVETYGWGEFCDFLYLRTPFGTSEHNGIEWQSSHLTGSPEEDRERYPHPLRAW